jgi:shikimate kinase
MVTGGARIPSFRRLLLVGFMGSGKSTVGARLASELGWEYADLDEEIEARVGRSIPQLFRQEGEGAFRDMEDRTARELLRRDRLVLATGGGWPCREGRLDGLDPETLTIWLKASPELVVRRTGRQRKRRPLLDVEDPLARARELMDEREPYYRKARWHVDTERRSLEEVVRVVIECLRAEPERPLRS